MAIERRTLRSQVRDELIDRMRTGRAQPGESINELQLAAELGVSRTPLREALIALESEGQIGSVGGKGFRFLPLSAAEFEDLAPVLAALEALALELSDATALREIGARLARMAAEFDQEVVEHSLVVSKDDEWHNVMISACPNTRLLDFIGSVRQAFHRYESLMVGDEVMIERVAAEHAEIARCLQDDNLAGAVAALKVNWLHGAQRIVENASSPYLTA